MKHVLGQVQLEEKADARISSLSGGQKQRLAVACALIGDPELLFLDEPTTGLDPQSRRQMWDVIDRFRASGRSIVLTTHYMDEAERLCDRIAIVDHGKVIARGTPAGLIASLGAEQMIEFASEGTAPLDLAGLRALEGVIDVRLDAGTYSLQAQRTAPRGSGAARVSRRPRRSAHGTQDALRDTRRRVRVAHREAPAR